MNVLSKMTAAQISDFCDLKKKTAVINFTSFEIKVCLLAFIWSLYKKS